MTQYIDKNKVEEILRNLWKKDDGHNSEHRICYNKALQEVQCELDNIEVKDPYEQCVQYSSVKDGIKAHAETYSFNIESLLFNQLTKEQQALWIKEIEQAVISGGEAGYELARDPRYKENHEVKEVDLEKEVDSQMDLLCNLLCYMDELSNGDSEGVYPLPENVIEDLQRFAKYFFELGLKARKGE